MTKISRWMARLLLAAASLSVPASAQPVISITKTADNASVNVGAQIGYTISATNNGTATTGFSISDTLPTVPGGTWSIAATPAPVPAAGWNLAGNSLSLGPINLGAGRTVSVHVTSTTTFSSCGTYNNTANWAIAGDGSGTSLQASIVVRCPRITLTKTADNASVNAGALIGFTISATNNGNGAAAGFTITDTLPTVPGVTWSIAATPAPVPLVGWNLSGNNLSLTPGVLGPSGSVSVHVTGRTTSESCGTYYNTAHYTTTNDGAGDSQQVSTEVRCARITLTKTADNASVNAGALIGFTISATNNGNGAAAGFTITDTLPTVPGVTWSIAATPAPVPLVGWNLSGNNLSLTPGVLGPSGSVSVHVTGRTTSESCGTYYNTAYFTTTNDGKGEASASTEVRCALIRISKTADDPSVSAGSSIGFTITATNSGNGDALGFQIADTLPTGAGITWSIASQSGGWNLAGNSLSYGPTTLLAGGTVTVHVTSPTSAISCGEYNNTARFTTTNDGSGDSNQASIEVRCTTADGMYHVRYASNLTQGDSLINITNTGANGASLNGPGFGNPAGNICVNVYAFSPDEQLISCCSCLVTPNGLKHLSVNNDLISNTLTGVRPDSIVIKLVATATGREYKHGENDTGEYVPTYNGSSCADSAALAGANFPIAPAGLLAWGTTLHSATNDPPPAGGSFSITETPFIPAKLSPDELMSIRNRCMNIVGNGSTFGQCRSCQLGGLGGSKL